jgi:uncharacterized protein (DUF433 family)
VAQQRSKQAVSFRFDRRTVRHLKSRSHEVNEPQAALAQRYIEEGLRMDEHPLIYFRRTAVGRTPALFGTRLDVATVIETIRQNDNSVEAAAEYLDLPVGHVHACVRYYADYKREIDDWIELNRRLAEREYERWLREQEVLAG